MLFTLLPPQIGAARLADLANWLRKRARHSSGMPAPTKGVMAMRARHFKCIAACALALLIPAVIPQIGHAQSPGQQTNQQAISQTGLLPVYGVDLDFDPSWVDKAEFPPNSTAYPHYGTNSVLRTVWDALKPLGFNAIRFPVDVRDDKSAVNQIANLCVWAQNSGAHLIPVLTGSDPGQAPAPQYPAQAARVVSQIVATLQKGGTQNLQTYTQILCYQIENELNHAGLHGPGSTQSSGQLLLAAAAAVRAAEQNALTGLGLNATPLAINASFDYELVNGGAIAGATLGDAAYSKAYDSMKQFLGALAASASVDAVAVDWFPGSISAGSVDRFPVLLHSLESDLAGKQIVLTTGFSTGFHSAEEQKNFYALAFANLADYRAHEGVSSPFAGLFFHGALNGADANPSPPSPDLAASVGAWDWPARSAELKRMWSGQGTSDALAWWLKKVTNNMGLASLSLDGSGNAAVAVQPAAVGLSQIANSVSQANTAAAAGSTGPNSTPGGRAAGGNPAATAFASGQSPATPSPQSPGAANSQVATGADSQFTPVANVQIPGANVQTPGNVPGTNVPGANVQTPGPGFQTPGTSGQTPGLGQSLGVELEKGLLTILDHVFDRVGNLIGGSGTNGSQFASGQFFPTQPGNQHPGGASLGPPGGPRPTILLSRQDVAIQPSSPAVGQQTIFSVTLRNLSPDVDAAGLVVALTDETNNVLSQVTDVSVARNSTQSVTAQWTPPEARLFRVTARVTDSVLNELARAALGPINVTGGQSPGAQVANLTAGQNPGQQTGNVTGGQNPGIQPAKAPGPAANQSTTVTKFSGGLGSPQMQALTVGNQGQPVIAGQASSVMLRVANPYASPMSGLSARLLVDGEMTQTRSLSSLLPHQSRSLVFSDVSFPQPGKHQVALVLEGNGARTPRATAETQITAIAQPPQSSISSIQSFISVTSSSSVRSIVPPVVTIGKLVLATAPQQAGAQPITAIRPLIRPIRNQDTVLSEKSGPGQPGAVGTTQPSAAASLPGRSTVRSLNAENKSAPEPELRVDAKEIRYGANSSGDIISFAVPLHNLGNADAGPARVVFVLVADGTPVEKSLEFTPEIKAGAAALVRWSARTPRARRLQLEVVVAPSEPGEGVASKTVIDLNPGGLTAEPQQQGRMDAARPGGEGGPVLEVARSEIRYEPARPRPKEPIEFLISVHNIGRGDADRARIICTVYADGRPGLRKEFDPIIKAGQSYMVRFRLETPAARELVLEVLAGADGAGERATSRASIPIVVAAVEPPRRR
jgi:hypothetical protein